MGWFDDDHPGHEGFLVGFIPRTDSRVLWRELASPTDREPVPHLARLAVGCDCGWRSSHFPVPAGLRADWHPYAVTLTGHHGDERTETLLAAPHVLWRAHLAWCYDMPVRDGAVALLVQYAAALLAKGKT